MPRRPRKCSVHRKIGGAAAATRWWGATIIFGKAPKSAFDAHRPLRADEDLDLILTVQASRCVSATLTVQYDRVIYLLEDSPVNRALAHQYLDVYEYPDGRIEIRANGAALTCRQHDRLSDIDQAAVVDNKRGLDTCCRSPTMCSSSGTTGVSGHHRRAPTVASRFARRCVKAARASSAN